MRWLDGITGLNGHEFEQDLGVGDGQGGLACSSPWGHKESDTTEQQNGTELKKVHNFRVHSFRVQLYIYTMIRFLAIKSEHFIPLLIFVFLIY